MTIDWLVMQEKGYQLIAVKDLDEKQQATLTAEDLATYDSVVFDPEGKPVQMFLPAEDVESKIQTEAYASSLDKAVTLINENNDHELKVAIKRVREPDGTFQWIAMIYFFDDTKSTNEMNQWHPTSPAEALCLAWLEYRKWAESVKAINEEVVANLP
jgi:hypothetical protein